MAAVVGVLAMVGLLLGGIALTGIGVLNLWEDHGVYQVAFKQTRDGCGIQKVTLDEHSGEPLFCTSLPTGLNNPKASFPGFTEEQNSNVFALAKQLAGDDGLSKAERQKIQDTVNYYAATLPADRRPQHGFWWGTNNLIAGLGAVGLGALLYAGLHSRAHSRARSKTR